MMRLAIEANSYTQCDQAMPETDFSETTHLVAARVRVDYCVPHRCAGMGPSEPHAHSAPLIKSTRSSLASPFPPRNTVTFRSQLILMYQSFETPSLSCTLSAARRATCTSPPSPAACLSPVSFSRAGPRSMILTGSIGRCRCSWSCSGIEMGTWRISTGPRTPLPSDGRPIHLPRVFTATVRFLDGKLQSYLGTFVTFPQPTTRPISDPFCLHSVLVVQQEPVYHNPACSEFASPRLIRHNPRHVFVLYSFIEHIFLRSWCVCVGLGYPCSR